jgi:hypothetical protein
LPVHAQTAAASVEGKAVDSKTGAPVRFAIVALTGPFLESERVGSGRPTRATTKEITADEQGRFVFKELAPGAYGLTARREGYEPILGATGTVRDMLNVEAGKNLDGITIKMPPCGVIAGKVVNEKGEPLRGVELVALRYYYGAWLWSPSVAPDIPLKVFSNDIGEFRIANLMHGQYIVRAAALPPAAPAGVTPALYPSVLFPNALTPENAQPLMVASGEVTRADFTLQPGPAYRITGTIDPGGSTGQVCFGLAPKNYNSALAQVIGRVARPANSTRFTIYDVPPGSYVLSAAICRGKEPLGAIQPIEVSGNIDGLDIRLGSGQAITGVVKGEGINPAGLRAILRSPEFLITPLPNARVGKDGAFRFENVLARHYLVELMGLPPRAYVKSVTYGGKQAPRVGFEPAPDATLEILVSAEGAAQFSGSVVTKDGRPAPYARITALPADGGPAESADDITADEEGNFTFPALRPGIYKALAWQTRLHPLGLEAADPMLPLLFDANARTVTLTPGAPQSVKLTLNTLEDIDRARAAARMTPPKNP